MHAARIRIVCVARPSVFLVGPKPGPPGRGATLCSCATVEERLSTRRARLSARGPCRRSADARARALACPGRRRLAPRSLRRRPRRWRARNKPSWPVNALRTVEICLRNRDAHVRQRAGHVDAARTRSRLSASPMRRRRAQRCHDDDHGTGACNKPSWPTSSSHALDVSTRDVPDEASLPRRGRFSRSEWRTQTP
jgi:hypothetical protein